MKRSFDVAAVVSVALVIAVPAPAQVPDGHLVVATCVLGTSTGQAGLWLVDPTPGAVAPVTLVTGLPQELRGLAGASAGSKCVARDPRSERLVAGNAVANGGSVGAWLLGLQGASVVNSIPLRIAVVTQFDAGVLAATFASNGDVLLATGGIRSGPHAYQPILRWTPDPISPPGVVTSIAIPSPYSSVIGNWCSALTISPDGASVFAVCKSNGLGQTLQFDLLAITLSTGAVQVVPDSMIAGEFVAQLTWDCNGDLIGPTVRFPQGLTGRLMRWREVAGVWTEIIPAQTWPGLVDANSGVANPATCEMFLGFLPGSGPTPLYRTNGTSTPAPVLSPAPAWGVVMGLDVNPNPEVFEAPTGVVATSWDYRPFLGGDPVVGNLQFAMPFTFLGFGFPFAFADFARTPGVHLLGIDVFLTAAAVLLPPPGPTGCGGLAGLNQCWWPLPLPGQSSLIGTEVFAQAVVLDLSQPQFGLGASNLLQFTIR